MMKILSRDHTENTRHGYIAFACKEGQAKIFSLLGEPISTELTAVYWHAPIKVLMAKSDCGICDGQGRLEKWSLFPGGLSTFDVHDRWSVFAEWVYCFFVPPYFYQPYLNAIVWAHLLLWNGNNKGHLSTHFACHHPINPPFCSSLHTPLIYIIHLHRISAYSITSIPPAWDDS